MRSPLIDFVDGIKAARDRLQTVDEATTKQYLVLQLLHLLGWNIFNELIPEYPVEDGRVDYAIQRDGINYLFIEVKRVGTDLQNDQEQLLRYAFHGGLKLSVLTNGTAWWLYLPLSEGRQLQVENQLHFPSTESQGRSALGSTFSLRSALFFTSKILSVS